MKQEKDIERKLTEAVRKKGGVALKFISPSLDGMPDRLVLLPHGKLGFVELKAPGKEPRPLQLARHEALRRLGFAVFVVDSEEQIGGVIGEILSS